MQALTRSRRVWCAFVFDPEILDPLPSRATAASSSSATVVVELDAGARRAWRRSDRAATAGRTTRFPRSRANSAWRRSSPTTTTSRRRCARRAVAALPRERGIDYRDPQGPGRFSRRDEVLTPDGKPFSVFTPYRDAWLQTADAASSAPIRSEKYPTALAHRCRRADVPSLRRARLRADQSARSSASCPACGRRHAARRTFAPASTHYRERRDFPGGAAVRPICRCTCASARSRSATLASRARAVAASATATARDLAVRADLARLLFHDPVHHPTSWPTRFQARVRRDLRFRNDPRAFRRLVRGPHRLSAGRCRDAPAQPDRLHAQPAAHGRRLRSWSRTCTSTGAGASAISPASSSTTTSRRTTAAGNGRRRPAAMRSRTSASSIR